MSATIAPLKLAEGAFFLRHFARAEAPDLFARLGPILEQAPLRRMMTPGGKSMSVAMSNCGAAGWVSDRRGYRYSPCDPETGRPWPPMPAPFTDLARRAAGRGGFPGFTPDACLINCYEAGARMSAHQDKDERDFTQPIVSVSLGCEAIFLFGGAKRSDPARRTLLESGDVVVWGGPARLFHHAIAPLKPGDHPLTGQRRYNLTFRTAL